VLLYVGDLDPSGEDIDRDFIERTDCWDDVIRLAVLPDQVTEFGLAPAVGKVTDSRAEAFLARHGDLFQVEVEALDPVALRGLLIEAVERFVDLSLLEGVMASERVVRGRLQDLADELEAEDEEEDE
jgi:hypothetical protein